MAEAMSEERLAEIRRHAENHWYDQGHGAGEAVAELLEENKRLAYQCDNERVAASGFDEVATEALADRDYWRGQFEQLAAQTEGQDEVRAEVVQLRAQLAKHTPGPVLRAWRGDNGDIIHGDRGWIRQAIKTHGGQHVIADTCSHVSDWREAEQEADRG